MQGGCREKVLTWPPSSPPADYLHTHQKNVQIHQPKIPSPSTDSQG